MSAQISAYGRLGDEPILRTSRAGNPWATASIAVDLNDGQSDGPPQWLGIVAFGQTAETLADQKKGDMVSLSGRLVIRRWSDDEGNERSRLQVVADTILSARSVRPRRKRRAEAEGAE